MKPDLKKDASDPRHHFGGVNMQKGRVELDADWNEASESPSAGLDVQNMDVEQAAQLILAKVSEDSHEDLNSALEELERIRKRKAAIRRVSAAMAGAALILLVGLIFGPRLFPSGNAASDPPQANANLPAVQVPVSNAAVPIGAAPGCKIALTSPASAVGLPVSGPVNVQWSSDPAGASYALEVQPPEGEPWVIPVDGDSKNIYMENFPAGGSYEFTVSALDAGGAILCSVAVNFDKPEFLEETARGEREQEGPAAECNPISFAFDPC
jgi:hypothetical protein